jgi:putative membrane protein
MREVGWFKWSLLAGALSWAMLAHAASAPQGPVGSDQEFVERALAVNEGEVQLGQLATERSGTPDVKTTGEKMVQNHTQLGQQLGGLASQLGASPTAELSAEQRDTLARLRAVPGSEFDPAFKQAVDEGHVKELAMYRDWLARTDNPQIRKLAAGRVEALQKSLGMTTPAQ